MSYYARLLEAARLLASEEAADVRQNGIVDYNDATATLHGALIGDTIDFKPAVLAALIRIEERLAKIESKGCSCK